MLQFFIERLSYRFTQVIFIFHFTMFIIHDHREIPDILHDPKDERKELAFMRRYKYMVVSIARAPQFKGNISIICENITEDNIINTEILLLNENMLNNINGISCFKNSPLHILSLSNNSLELLPNEVRFLLKIDILDWRVMYSKSN